MYEYMAVINSVIDGDTLDVTIDLGFGMSCRNRVRLVGVDTPELHKRAEIVEARKAREAVRALCEGKTVRIITRKGDSFGRWLAVVYLSRTSTLTGTDYSLSLGDMLVERGLARPLLM